MNISLGNIFEIGGPFFYVNTLFLAVIIAIVIDRAIYFLGKGQINAKAFLEQIRRLLAQNDLDRAKKLCDATSAPVARVAKAGLARVHRGEAAIAQSMEEAMTDVSPEVKKRISALWSMANIVTLTGLLGTVTGLIRTFAGIADADPAESKRQLSEGIAEAMVNTAYGLSLALVCMVAHLLLSTASKKVVADLESFSLKLENMLGDGSTGGQAAG
ncbi:MAG: MotA/TolQ/ExbB proton channel family protein [Deltaproteobacteria bacterium]|jgi:biopolymer transport protein ExbB/TolQ|nr:MotA/TolQ/ExbB proton channel family protein [Deltaproteobacteria bacterium]